MVKSKEEPLDGYNKVLQVYNFVNNLIEIKVICLHFEHS